MSQVRWHYEHLIYEENSYLMFFFVGENAVVVASTTCGGGDEGIDLTERFVKGEEVELPLEFHQCRCSDSASEAALDCPAKEPDGLHFDHDSCETIHGGSLIVHRDPGDDIVENSEDEFYGTGLVSRLPRQNGHHGEIRFEVHRDTATGIMAQLIDQCSLTDFFTFQIFSQIAPDSFSLASLPVIGTEADQPSVSSENTQARRLADRLEPPTTSKTRLTAQDFVELLKDPNARISYRQLYIVIPCKPQTLRGHLIDAGLAEKGVRLTNQTFSASELVSDLVPYLQKIHPLGEKAYRLLRLFDKAGHTTL